MPSGSSSVATDATKKKKKKKNVIKSIAKGMSFKKKKKFVDDDTVVGVAVEPKGTVSNKAATARSAASPAAKPIQVVLLLMDPNSRRFELLQLEFDSNKALVSDVVRQVQSSATEDTLRNLSYGGVCDQDGTEMIQSLKLSNFCMGNEIVMAIPKGMNGKATLQLAQPILSDPKVADMVSCYFWFQQIMYFISCRSYSNVFAIISYVRAELRSNELANQKRKWKRLPKRIATKRRR